MWFKEKKIEIQDVIECEVCAEKEKDKKDRVPSIPKIKHVRGTKFHLITMTYKRFVQVVCERCKYNVVDTSEGAARIAWNKEMISIAKDRPD